MLEDISFEESKEGEEKHRFYKEYEGFNIGQTVSWKDSESETGRRSGSITSIIAESRPNGLPPLIYINVSRGSKRVISLPIGEVERNNNE